MSPFLILFDGLTPHPLLLVWKTYKLFHCWVAHITVMSSQPQLSLSLICGTVGSKMYLQKVLFYRFQHLEWKIAFNSSSERPEQKVLLLCWAHSLICNLSLSLWKRVKKHLNLSWRTKILLDFHQISEATLSVCGSYWSLHNLQVVMSPKLDVLTSCVGKQVSRISLLPS